jgi:hypothetical protein
MTKIFTVLMCSFINLVNLVMYAVTGVYILVCPKHQENYSDLVGKV